MKLLLAAVALVSLPFGLCGDEADELDSAEAQAVRLVRQVLNQDVGAPVPVGSDYACVTVFGEDTGLQPVEMNCRFDLEEQAPNYIVTFREVWRCDDFAADHPDYPPCDGLTGFHEWVYLVNPRGDVQLLDETGQYPPDYALQQ